MENTTESNGGGKYPKTDVRYWRKKLFTRTNKDLNVQIGFAGRQERFPLKTPNKEQAATTARDIYLSLQSTGWDATIAKFKPWTVEAAKESVESCTVGKFIEAVKAVANIKPATFLTYERKFRFLVSQIKAVQGGKDRHDYVNGGSEKWRDKIDAVPLSDITPEEIAKWRVNYISKHSSTPLKRQAAQTTVISILRNSKSLFSPDHLQFVKLTMPDPLPFAGIVIGKPPRTRYKSKMNAALLVKLAEDELKPNKPELYKIFLLALGAGVRRSEIDKLTWKQFHWTKSVISIETTEHGATKSEDSNDEIDIDDDMLAYFKAQFAESKSEFVITPRGAADEPKHWVHYQSDHHFSELIEWLRSKGVKEQKPLHTLRKEFGSLINKKFGIYAASAACRHSNINVTRDYYVDKKERIALDLGELMEGAKA